MPKEGWISLAIELVALSLGGYIAMTGAIPPEIGWPIVIATGLGGVVVFIYGLRKKEILSPEKQKDNDDKWEHYNKLVDLIISMENEPHEKWSELVANMQRELSAIGDKTINKHMRLYFPVLDEEQEFGIKPDRAISQLIIDRTREHMLSKYKR